MPKRAKIVRITQYSDGFYVLYDNQNIKCFKSIEFLPNTASEFMNNALKVTEHEDKFYGKYTIYERTKKGD